MSVSSEQRVPRDDPALEDVRTALPGYVKALGVDDQDVEDYAQETVARVLAVRDRLDDEVVGSYAFVTARNLVVSRRRSHDAARRRLPDLLDPTQHESGEDFTERREREKALLTALARLDANERDVLISHELHGESTHSIGHRHGKRPTAIAMQLARLRARVRLDYLLALRRAAPASARCTPVLLAISAGDVRRQREHRSAEHLMTCTDCAGLAPPLMERKLWLAALWPLGLGAVWVGARRWWSQSTPARTVQASGMVAAAAVTALALNEHTTTSSSRPTAAASPQAVPSTLATWAPGFAVAAHVGRPVMLHSAPVLSVPADEGFWVGTLTDRMWVAIDTSAGAESRQHVRPGDLVSGLAQVASVSAAPRTAEPNDPSDVAALQRLGAYARIEPGQLRVDR